MAIQHLSHLHGQLRATPGTHICSVSASDRGRAAPSLWWEWALCCVQHCQGAAMCQSQASRWPWAPCDCQGLLWVLNWEPGVSDCINQQLIFYLYREKNKIQSYFRNVQAIYIWLLHLWDTWPAQCKQMAAASWAGVKSFGNYLVWRGQSRDTHTSTGSGVKPNHAHLVNLMLKIK